MPPIVAFFPRVGVSALSFIQRPAGNCASWNQGSVWTGGQAKYLGPAAGTAQQSLAPTFTAIPNATSHDIGVVQLLSDPLAKQELAAGNWRVAFAAQVANAGATFTWKGRAALYVVNGATGARRATIFNLRDIGSTGRTATNERTCYQATAAGLACSIFGGDYLCLELGVAVSNATGAGLAPQVSVFADGVTPIAADFTATTNAKAVLVSPQGLYLSLPEPGEQPFASVSLPEAVDLFKRSWPPGCQNDWNDTTSPDYEWVLWLAELLKRYGWDVLDLLGREIDFRRMTLSLPLWEGLFELQPPAGTSLEQRRRYVIGRWRENGPSTLHAIAAAAGELAGFTDPSQVPLIEVPAETLQAANVWSEVVPAGLGVIPEDAAFDDASNLVRLTPALLDGGVVWDAGALLICNFSSSQTSYVRARLTGPDYTSVDFAPVPAGLSTAIYYRSASFAGKAMHGAWQLNLWREVGMPAIQLSSWLLYVLGRGHGGRGQWKFAWALYLDAAHRSGDERLIQAFLSRVRHAGHHVRLVYEIAGSFPGTANHRPGLFLPGA